MFSKRLISWVSAASLVLACAAVRAQDMKTPEALIKEVSTDVLDAVKADKTIHPCRASSRAP